ncbi:MAG: hypothetical protein ABID63_13905 [Pseudomonadota bacterium]
MKWMSVRKLRVVLAGVAVAFVAACTSAPAPTYPDVTWRHLAPITFAAGPVEKVAAYSVGGANELEGYLPFSLGRMAMRWPDDRIQTAGTTDILRYSVTEASITSSALKTTKGVRGVFTDDQSERVDLKISVKLEVLGANGMQKGEAIASAARSRTLAQSMSVAERESAIYDETAALLKDIDLELERQINANLGRFLLR